MRLNHNLRNGDKVTVNDLYMGVIRTRKCTVVKEYPYFILVDFGYYRGTISKADEICKAVRVWDGWKGEA